jgi:hypothetical protein
MKQNGSIGFEHNNSIRWSDANGLEIGGSIILHQSTLWVQRLTEKAIEIHFHTWPAFLACMSIVVCMGAGNRISLPAVWSIDETG